MRSRNSAVAYLFLFVILIFACPMGVAAQEVGGQDEARKIRFVPKANIESQTVYVEKYGETMTFESVVPGSKEQTESLDNPVLGADLKLQQKWLDFLLSHVRQKGFTGDQTGWFGSYKHFSLQRASIRQVGGLKGVWASLGMAIIECTGEAQVQGRWETSITNRKINFVAILLISEDGVPLRVLRTFAGIDGPGDSVRTVKVKFITNLDEDADYEIVIEDVRYAGSGELILSPIRDQSLDIRSISTGSWD